MAQRLDQPMLHWVDRLLEAAMRALLAGNTNRAEQLVTEAVQIGTDSGQPDVAVFFGAQIIGVNWQHGSLDTLVPPTRQSVTDNPGLLLYSPPRWLWRWWKAIIC